MMSFFSEPTGEPRQQFPPWPEMEEKDGGEVIIHCSLIVTKPPPGKKLITYCNFKSVDHDRNH